nr:flagellar hook-length control protein FliK [Microbacterium hydrocarbonoxydans]
MTTVSLLGALAADPSATNTTSGRETSEPGTPFDEIIVQVRELASGADVPSRERSTSSAEDDLATAPAQAQTDASARDLAAAAALLGVVDETPAVPEAGAGARGADDAESAETAEASAIVAALDTSILTRSDTAAATAILDTAVGSPDPEAEHSASAPASASPAAVTAESPVALSSFADSAASAASAGLAGSARPQGSSPAALTAAEHAPAAQAPDADSGQPLHAPTPGSSAAGAAGVPPVGESPAPAPVRTLSSLPDPMGSYADIMASAGAAEGDGIAEPVLTVGDRAVSPAAATAATGSGAGAASGLSAIAQTVVVPAAPVVAAGDVAPDAARTVAAQVAPVVLNIAQRPAGAHQLTMTVNPDSLGPVTVRAHISQAGEVQVELIGGTDAGRDALKSIVADLRRDLAAVSPHATLSVSTGVSADPGSARGGHPGAEASTGDQGARRDGAPEQRGHRPGSDRGDELAHLIRITTSTRAGVGEGLDTFA